MEGIPVIGFAGFSGSGKTTLIEKLIPVLSDVGLHTAIIKHDAHGLAFDQKGKDSWRFYQAGAKYSIVSGPGQTALFLRQEPSLTELLAMVRDVDLILIEGYKNHGFTQFGVCRRENGKGFPAGISRYAALVTDLGEEELEELEERERESSNKDGRKIVEKDSREVVGLERQVTLGLEKQAAPGQEGQGPSDLEKIPVFSLDDPEEVAAFIVKNLDSFTRFIF